MGVFWCGVGLELSPSHSIPFVGVGWGGSIPGTSYTVLEGLFVPSGASPEVPGCATPDSTAGQRASGYVGVWVGVRGAGIDQVGASSWVGGMRVKVIERFSEWRRGGG